MKIVFFSSEATLFNDKSKIGNYCLILYFAFSLFFNNNGNLIVGQKHMMYVVLLSLGAIIVTSLWKLTVKESISISIIDVTVSIYFLYIILNSYLHDASFLQQSRTPGIVIFIISYLLFRGANDVRSNINIFFQCYFCCSIILLVYGYLQLFHIVDSNHEFFPISGSFHNPAPYACQLAITAIVTVFNLFNKYENRRSLRRYDVQLLAGLFVLDVILLIIIASRAAIIAAVAGMCIFVFMKMRKSHAIILFLLIIVSLFLLYFIREDSANSRVFIWKICMHLFSENPLFGIGYNKFVVGYNMEQAEYFSSGLATRYEAFISDTAYHPFNEFLLILIEEGIIGLLIFCTIIYLSFRVKPKDYIDQLVKAVLIALLTFGLFSYPLNYACFNILLFVCVAYWASLSSMGIKISGIYRITQTLVLLGSLMTIRYAYPWAQKVYRWNNAKQLSEYDQLYSMCKYNGFFLVNYGIVLYENDNYEKSAVILNDAKSYFVNGETLIYSGDAYKKSGCFRESESAYILSSYMTPNRLKPKYKLAELYLEEGDSLHAIQYAEEVLKMPLKVDNEASKEIISNTEMLIYRIHHIE